MTKETKKSLIKETKDLIKAPMTFPELKTKGEAFLKALGTAKEAEATAAFTKELEEDITQIDDLVAFASSEEAIEEFGSEGAAKFLAHAKDLKLKGATHCDCPACTAASHVLDLLK